MVLSFSAPEWPRLRQLPFAGFASALLACTQAETSFEERHFDSILVAAEVVGTDYTGTLSETEKSVVLRRVADLHELISSFLDRLPLDTTPATAIRSEIVDTVFGYFTQDSTLTQTRAQLLWGELQADSAREIPEGLQACARKESCFKKAREFPMEARLKQPKLAAVKKPDIDAFLREALKFGEQAVPIREVRHKDAKRAVARAVCIGNERVIQYSPEIDKRFSPIAFTFIRAHEFAHFRLRHVTCESVFVPPSVSIKTRELDADCEAAKVIMAKIPVGGIAVVAHVAGEFWQLNWPERDYPSTRDRSDSLYRDVCE